MARLCEICAPFGVHLTPEVLDRLDIYANLLIETNKQFNLTAITEPEDMTVKHFADSLSILGFADFSQNAKVIDVGTGAGFPGAVLKIARPDLKLTFLDSTKKKLGFIDNVLKECGLAGETLHARAEEAGQSKAYREQYDFAVARAVAALPNLSEYCLPFVKVGGAFISMKAAASDEELSSARSAIRLLGGNLEKDDLFDLVENTPRRIFTIRKISQTPPKYPRPSAQIAKKPLK